MATSNERLLHRYLEERATVKEGATVYGEQNELLALAKHLGRMPFQSVTEPQLFDWVNRPITKGRRGAGSRPSSNTLRRRMSQVSMFYGWLERRMPLPGGNPTLEWNGKRPEQPDDAGHQPAPLAEWRRLWASDLCDSDRVAFGLWGICGLRGGETCSIRPDGFVDRPEPKLAFRQKGGKVGHTFFVTNATKMAQLCPELIADPNQFLDPMERLRRGRQGKARLLDWAERMMQRPSSRPSDVIPTDQTYRRLHRAYREAGMDPMVLEAHPHRLRKLFADHLYDASGGDIRLVQAMLRHKYVNTTQVYLRDAENPLRDFAPEGDDDVALEWRNRWSA